MLCLFLISFCLTYTMARPEAGYHYIPPANFGSASSSGSSFSNAGYSHPNHFSISSGQSSGGSVFASGSSSGSSSLFTGSHQQPTVFKHVYVHIPPKGEEDLPPPYVAPPAPPQKHYKIIFIKSPSPPKPVAPIIPVIPQNEEKTIVFVLVQKPKLLTEIVVPTPVPTKPSKPEVYFIKYKTEKGPGIKTDGSFASSGTGSFSTDNSGSLSTTNTGSFSTEFKGSGSSGFVDHSILDGSASGISSASGSAAVHQTYGPPHL